MDEICVGNSAGNDTVINGNIDQVRKCHGYADGLYVVRTEAAKLMDRTEGLEIPVLIFEAAVSQTIQPLAAYIKEHAPKALDDAKAGEKIKALIGVLEMAEKSSGALASRTLFLQHATDAVAKATTLHLRSVLEESIEKLTNTSTECNGLFTGTS